MRICKVKEDKYTNMFTQGLYKLINLIGSVFVIILRKKARWNFGIVYSDKYVVLLEGKQKESVGYLISLN